MGPVSFESLDAGPTRADALRYAAVLRDGGIRVMSILDPGDSGAPFRLLVRSAEVTQAAELMAAMAESSPGSGDETQGA